jgi:hypothetical protein
MSQSWLAVLAVLTISACGLGLMVKLVRLLRLGWPRHIPASLTLIGAPAPLPWFIALRRMLLSPSRHFHRFSSRVWTTGYAFYHSAILMVVGGYAVSSIIIICMLVMHAPILDFTSHALIAGPTGIANVLVLIFGNAEQLPSSFLFGSWAPWFRALAWCELPLAVTGNVCLLSALFQRRLGAVRHDLDPAVQNLRLRGVFSGQHLLVRSTIFSIILLEFIGRFDWIPGIAYGHAALGMLLIALFPFTYLAHIPLAPLALGLAILRRRRHAIA